MLFLAGLRSQVLPGVLRPPAEEEALEASRAEEVSDSGVGKPAPLPVPVAPLPAPPPALRMSEDALRNRRISATY